MIPIKTDREIELMREPNKIVRDVLLLLESKLKIGITTKELDEIAFKYITKYGAQPSFLGYNNYPASICVSIDEQVVHGIPSSERIILDNQIVSIDVGAYYNGFHGDAARSFCTNNICTDKKKLVDVTRECFFKAIENLKDGSFLNDIGKAVQKLAEKNGYTVVRALVGHGIGKNMHEEPSVANYDTGRNGIRLKSGMTLAIEPMINAGGYEVDFLNDGWTVVTRDKKPSAHYENTVLITKYKAEILTL